jgi:hypothetical protein
MRKLALGAAWAALILAGGTAANAQLFHRPKTPPQQPSPSDMAATCNQLKAMPNPPMSYDACMQLAASQQAMQAAQNDPAGVRPGDDAMTCDQIKAEFAANGGLKIDKTQMAQSQAATQNFIAKNKQIQGEARAMEARETATNVAAAAAAYTPFGGAAAAAAQARQAADTAALNAKAQKELVPTQQQMTSSTAGMMTNVSAQMQANPRQARLMSLAQQKNCRGGAPG